MKIKKLNKFVLVAIAGFVLFVASCKKDDSSPDNGTDARDKYVRSWTCNETSQQQGNSTYTITISKDVTSSSQIVVKNFYALGNTANTIMIVDGNNVTISTQNVSGNILHGSGIYNSSSSLTFSFTADDGQNVDQVSINAH
ncbi:MAG: hypothetical protein JJE25_14665 [Bacteroidia bacterium]|nr:hypothetical protein [Bacteroidia bacterium]